MRMTFRSGNRVWVTKTNPTSTARTRLQGWQNWAERTGNTAVQALAKKKLRELTLGQRLTRVRSGIWQ